MNGNKSVKEWIITSELQHVLQGVDLKGEHMPGGIIRGSSTRLLAAIRLRP